MNYKRIHDLPKPRLLTMSSGVKVIICPREGCLTSAVGIFVDVGSNNERVKKECGCAHAVEHMLFKSTKYHSTRELNDTLTSLGVEYNAYTDHDRTVYHALAPFTSLRCTVSTLLEMLMYPKFDYREFDLERGAILSEIKERGEHKDTVTFEHACSRLFEKNKRLGIPVIGTEKSVTDLTDTDLILFHGRHYTAENITIVIVGYVDDETINIIDVMTRDINKGKPRPIEKIVPTSGCDEISISAEQAHIGSISLVNKNDIPGTEHILDVLFTIYGGGCSSRLYKEIREKRGLAYSTFSYYTTFGKKDYLTYAYAATDSKNVNKVKKLIDSISTRLVEYGPTTHELDLAKKGLIGNLMMTYDSLKSYLFTIGNRYVTFKELVDIANDASLYAEVSREEIATMSFKAFSSPCWMTIAK